MKKDQAVSSIRMISTIMVVILHIFQQLEKTLPEIHIATDWLNLGLVLFFCISGFLYSRRINVREGGRWFLHRYKEICLPSLITVILTIFIYSALYGFPGIQISLYSIASGLGFEPFVPDSWMFVQYWFICYILICYLSLLLLQRLDVKKMSSLSFWMMLILATVVFQTLGFLIGKTGIPTLSWGVLLRFFLVYLLYKKYDGTDTQRKIFIWLTLISIPAIATTCIVRYRMQLDGVYAAIGELLFIYTQTLVGSVLFYWMHQFFTKYRLPKALLKISDRYSYPVFLTHCLFIGYKTSMIFRFEHISIGVIVSIGCTAIASVLLCRIIDASKKVQLSKRT